jgi:hypothetical protein
MVNDSTMRSQSSWRVVGCARRERVCWLVGACLETAPAVRLATPYTSLTSSVNWRRVSSEYRDIMTSGRNTCTFIQSTGHVRRIPLSADSALDSKKVSITSTAESDYQESGTRKVISNEGNESTVFHHEGVLPREIHKADSLTRRGICQMVIFQRRATSTPPFRSTGRSLFHRILTRIYRWHGCDSRTRNAPPCTITTFTWQICR